jgi:hypothetical protein
MIVLFRQLLPGLAEHGAARAALGVEAARRIRLLGELACSAGTALARRLGCRRLGIRLLPARRRQRGVVRRLGRLPELGFQLGDAGVQGGNLRQQLPVLPQQAVDTRQQLAHQRLQAISIERIKPLGRHPELESARGPAFNPLRLSHAAAQGE